MSGGDRPFFRDHGGGQGASSSSSNGHSSGSRRRASGRSGRRASSSHSGAAQPAQPKMVILARKPAVATQNNGLLPNVNMSPPLSNLLSNATAPVILARPQSDKVEQNSMAAPKVAETRLITTSTTTAKATSTSTSNKAVRSAAEQHLPSYLLDDDDDDDENSNNTGKRVGEHGSDGDFSHSDGSYGPGGSFGAEFGYDSGFDSLGVLAAAAAATAAVTGDSDRSVLRASGSFGGSSSPPVSLVAPASSSTGDAPSLSIVSEAKKLVANQATAAEVRRGWICRARRSLLSPYTLDVSVVGRAGQLGDSPLGALFAGDSRRTDFTAVGILGMERAGKSTIANMLCGAGRENAVFPLSTCYGEHTLGLDLAIGSGNVIVLDAQPLLSSALTADLARARSGQAARHSSAGLQQLSGLRSSGSSNDAALPRQLGLLPAQSSLPVARGPSGDASGSLPPELAHLMHSLEVVLLMLSVCHVVVVVADGPTGAGGRNSRLWEFLHTAAMLKSRIADVSLIALGINQPGKFEREYLPHVGIVLNRTPLHMYETDAALSIAKQLSAAVPSEFHARGSAMVPPVLERFNGATGSVPRGPSFAYLPDRTDGFPSETAPAYELFDTAATRLRAELLHRRHRFARSVTAPDWLRAVSKVWEHLGRSRTMADYARSLQRSISGGKS